MLSLSDLFDRMSGGMGLRRDLLLDHRRDAAKPWYLVWSVASHLRDRGIGDLRYEAQKEESGLAVLSLRSSLRDCGILFTHL